MGGFPTTGLQKDGPKQTGEGFLPRVSPYLISRTVLYSGTFLVPWSQPLFFHMFFSVKLEKILKWC